MSKGDKAVIKYLMSDAAGVITAAAGLWGLMSGMYFCVVKTDNTFVFHLLNLMAAALIRSAVSTVMNGYFTDGKVLTVLPVKKERAAELCLTVSTFAAVLPFIAEITVALIYAAIGMIPARELLAALSLPFCAAVIIIYGTAWAFPRFLAVTETGGRADYMGIFYIVLVFTCCFECFFLQIAVQKGNFGWGYIIPAVIGAAMLIPYGGYAKKSVQEAIKHREEYYL